MKCELWTYGLGSLCMTWVIQSQVNPDSLWLGKYGCFIVCSCLVFQIVFFYVPSSLCLGMKDHTGYLVILWKTLSFWNFPEWGHPSLCMCTSSGFSVYSVLWDWGSLMLLFFRRIWCEGSPWTPEWTPSYIGWGRATCWNHWCSTDASLRDPWRSAKACGMPSTPLSF